MYGHNEDVMESLDKGRHKELTPGYHYSAHNAKQYHFLGVQFPPGVIPDFSIIRSAKWVYTQLCYDATPHFPARR